ncbi:unnamed protein product [Adineta ricciae]|uniref:E3 ubiquitin-protein ligase n=1 Tax=Adineta ricciae TaxID=249248 RepID=A0A814TYF4_ADIRI|nr:unnamed protein product [Adineta ricciae]
MSETLIHEDILSLVVYLCELALDDQIRRLKYGKFLNNYTTSAIQPLSYEKNVGAEDSRSSEIPTETKTQLEPSPAQDQIVPSTPFDAIEKNETLAEKKIIDGKYETFYESDDIITNAHTIIGKISFEQIVLDDGEDQIASKVEEHRCVYTEPHFLVKLPVNTSRQVLIQANAKTITESKPINLSLVQILVCLLAKVLFNINNETHQHMSLNDVLFQARMKRGKERFGNGIFYLTRLLIKLERLSDECKVQMNDLVHQIDSKQSTYSTDNADKKTKAKEMQQKMFERIAKKQQNILDISTNTWTPEVASVASTMNNNLECCICQNKDDNAMLGFVVRLNHSGVLGVREVSFKEEDHLPLVTDNFDFDQQSCCHPHDTPTDDGRSQPNPPIPPLIIECLTNFIQKIYMMVNSNDRTLKKQNTRLTDDDLALFLVSILRFNLENELLLREIVHNDSTINNRKSCFHELFYVCNMKYPYLLNESHILLWQHLIGLIITVLKTTEHGQKPPVPLLLTDPIALLLRIVLSLPYLVDKELYQIVVQAVYNLVYVQALFSIVNEMPKYEQQTWNSLTISDKSENDVLQYLCVISTKLLQTDFNINTENVRKCDIISIKSHESINATIRDRCIHFLKVAALMQHHLYRPQLEWAVNHQIESDYLWGSLIKELGLYKSGEPYWFYNNSSLLINHWLDETLSIENSQLIRQLVLRIPVFHCPQFVKLPTCYSELFRSCYNLRCSYCQAAINEPSLCLVCGFTYSDEHCRQRCCESQTQLVQEHLRKCCDGLNISINANSTRTLIQQEQRYTYWISLYLDRHGEEDINLRRGRTLYLNENRLKFLYSAWVSSNLDQIIQRWSTDQLEP